MENKNVKQLFTDKDFNKSVEFFLGFKHPLLVFLKQWYYYRKTNKKFFDRVYNELVEHCDINDVDSFGANALFYAVNLNVKYISLDLIRRGINIHHVNRSGRNVLFYVRDNLFLLKYLLNAGVSPFVRDKDFISFMDHLTSRCVVFGNDYLYNMSLEELLAMVRKLAFEYNIGKDKSDIVPQKTRRM